MLPSSRKRRAPTGDDEAPTPTQARRNRRQEETVDDDEVVEDEEQESGSGSVAQLSKNLVRYALACEHSRLPIKRPDVGAKILGTHTRQFRAVFDAANSQLMDVFGMRMVELPVKEKVTVRQKRAAVASESGPKSSNTWIVQNILPDKFRISTIIGPGRDPPEDVPDTESAYIGLYTVVIALILLSGGTLSEPKLDRFLRRMNADRTTPVDSTDKLLVRMAKEGYILKVKEAHGGEEVVDYMVGPRGKIEVGKEGAASFVRHIYGNTTEDLEQRLPRSLQLTSDDGEGQHEAAAVVQSARKPGRVRRRDSDDD